MTNKTVQAPKYTLDKFNGTSSNFTKLSQPPDSNGAIGPYHYVEFLNGVFTVYDKFTHAKLAQITDQQFWIQAGIPQPGSLVDPRILFVPNGGKYGRGQWLAVQLSFGYSVYLACTDPHMASPSPLPGAWKAAQFDMRGCDFPQVGYDGRAIYLTVQTAVDSELNQESEVNTKSEPKTESEEIAAAAGRRSQIVFLPQVSALAFPPQVGDDSGMKIFAPLDPQIYGNGLYPVADSTGSEWKTATFVCANDETLRQLTYVKMLTEQRVIASHGSIDVPPWEFMGFTYVKQPAASGAQKVAFYSSDINAAPVSDGFNIWLTHTVKKFGSLAVRWYRLAIDPVSRDLSLANSGELSDPKGHYDYFNSSIASFGKDDYTVVCFSRSGDSTTSSDPNDPNCGNLGAYAAIIREDGSEPTIVPIQSGKSNNFQPLANQSYNRWGDFSTIWRDTSDLNSRNMWLINQYVAQGGSSSEWCEVIANLHIDPPRRI
ncbi:MAG: hypothetical protein P4L53_12405 [Candidatus Obscuribacterales bacterium]|nr:hypothetical protein [Candidatus Obscuribacterales bacterium]